MNSTLLALCNPVSAARSLNKILILTNKPKNYLKKNHDRSMTRSSIRIETDRDDPSTENEKRQKYKRVAGKYPIWHENEKEDAPVRTNGGHRPLFTQVKMAALRLFTRSKLSTIILSYSSELYSSNGVLPVITQKRWGSYNNSPKYIDPSNYTDYEVSKDPKEWEYVERLLKPKVIPIPHLEKKEYPSGWKPPVAKPNEYPYYIQRTKNYMQPVYLEISQRGLRRLTLIRKIHGDIWELESELKQYLEKKTCRPIGIRTNELLGQIVFRGDYVDLVKAWMDEKGF